jgi:hypothetical protein
MQVGVQDSPLLRALLVAAGNDLEVREIIRQAYQVSLEGYTRSPFVMNAVLLSAIGKALLQSNPKMPKQNGELSLRDLDGLRLDVGAARDLLVSGQNRSHRLLEENFGRLWKVIKDRQKAPVPTSEGWRKWKWIGLGDAALLVILAPILSYQHGVSVGERDLAGQVAQTLKDSAALGPWITTHKGFLIFEPTLSSDGKSFRSIVVVFPGLRNEDLGLTARGSAFINLPDATPH